MVFVFFFFLNKIGVRTLVLVPIGFRISPCFSDYSKHECTCHVCTDMSTIVILFIWWVPVPRPRSRDYRTTCTTPSTLPESPFSVVFAQTCLRCPGLGCGFLGGYRGHQCFSFGCGVFGFFFGFCVASGLAKNMQTQR